MEQRVLSPASLNGETRIQVADAATVYYPNFRRNLSLLSKQEGPSPDSAFSHQATAGGIIATDT